MMPALPYVQERYTMNEGNVSYDFAPIKSRQCWREAFPTNEIDWEAGWRQLWHAAARLIGNGTDFMVGRLALELQLYFGDGSLASAGVGYPCELEDAAYWEPRVAELIAEACGTEMPITGCIGVVVDEHDSQSRPCLTMLVSGPGGAQEAAMILRKALVDQGVGAGIAIRTVRNEAAGVVKVPFLPELYLEAGHDSYGLDWALWQKLAVRDSALEWSSAALYWCDCVVAAAREVQEYAPLIVDETYFDFMRVVPIGSHCPEVELDPQNPKFAKLMNRLPHQFLFPPRPGN